MTKIIAALILFSMAQAANAQGRIYKCVEDGKTLYSESSCKKNEYDKNIFITRDERMGNVSPDRETIETTRARIREEISAPASTQQTSRNGNSTTTTKKAAAPAFDKHIICEAAENDIKAIDARARQANSASVQDRLRERKMKVRQRQSQYKC